MIQGKNLKIAKNAPKQMRTNNKLYINMRKASKKTLKKKCDDLWRDLIRKTYCEYCNPDNKPSTHRKFDSHHIIGRGNNSTRHDLRNGINLCYSCHKGSKNSVEQDPQRFMNWMEIKRGEDYDYLLIKKQEEVKLTIEFYQDTLRRLQEEYDRI